MLAVPEDTTVDVLVPVLYLPFRACGCGLGWARDVCLPGIPQSQEARQPDNTHTVGALCQQGLYPSYEGTHLVYLDMSSCPHLFLCH